MTTTTKTSLKPAPHAYRSAPHAYRRPSFLPMTRADIFAKIAVNAGITMAQAEAAYDALLAIAYAGAKKTGGITLPGLFKLFIGKRAARTVVYPKTKEKIRIPAAKTVKVKVLKTFHDSVVGKR